MSDELGNRMKLYELTESGRRLMPLLPVIARIDGRAFSGFTNGMARPFDITFSKCMQATALALMYETGARLAYTQSDEITLVWHSTNIKSQIWFDGRVAKMVSQLSAHATLAFNEIVRDVMPEYAPRRPTFDARVWNVPNRAEAANAVLWREQDATKNSISMAASHYYTHAELMNKGSGEKQDLLYAVGVNWNDYPTAFKRGVFLQRRKEVRTVSEADMETMHPSQRARVTPGMQYERTVIRQLDMPPFMAVTNREAVVLDGADPETATVET